MPSKSKRENAKESLRQEIMDAARELFVNEGYERVSMRRIADRIGYSATTIYLYFDDKADLMTQICEQAFGELTRKITAINRRSADPIEGLHAGMAEYINFGLRHPSHYLLLFGTTSPKEMKVSFENSNGKLAFETLREAVSRCIDSGRFRTGDVELISQSLWAGLHGITSLLITQRHFPFVARKRLIENTIQTMIAGAAR